MALYTAFLDSCVLVPICVADTLLRLAERDLYRPVWSNAVTGEVVDAVIHVHPGIDRPSLQRRIDDMNTYFPDACVTGWESIEAALVLPDPDDRHVLAAAIRGRADAIVTANLDDFPAEALDPFGIVAVHPDEFLLDQLDLAPKQVIIAIQEQAGNTRNPALSPTDLIARLARAGVPEFADVVGRMI